MTNLFTFDSNQTHPQITNTQTPFQANGPEFLTPNRNTSNSHIRNQLAPRQPQPLQILGLRDRGRSSVPQLRRIGQIDFNQARTIRRQVPQPDMRKKPRLRKID